METQESPRPIPQDEPPRAVVKLVAPFYWRYRKLAAIITGPLIIVALIFAWTWIPMSEARTAQKDLAHEFFRQCTLIFTDTSQIPKIPDEALRLAQQKQSITMDALRSWSPQVKGEIIDGYWWAHIQFASPSKKAYQQRIGVAVNDVGYNTPSERSQHLDPDASEP